MFQSTSTTNKISNEQVEKTANDLIPELISKISKYSTHLKERVKIYSIFREFDTYAHMNLQNFIKMSDKRYHSIKSGNNLKNVLNNQKKEFKDLSEKILTNKLYSDENIENEEKKLYKKINYKENKELYKIRHDILEKTKDLTKKELEKREKYLKNRNLKYEKLIDINQINKSNNNKTSYESFMKSKLANKSMLNIFNKNLGNKNNINYIDSLKNNINANTPLNDDFKNKIVSMNKSSKAKEILKIKKDFLDDLIKKDNQNINDNILDYKLFLKDLENSKNKNNSRIINEGNNFGHTFSFKDNEIKLLSFQEEQGEIEQLTKKENPEVNVKALIKYTKRGNRKWFLDNIKMRSKLRQNSFMEKLKHKKFKYNIQKKYNIAPTLLTKSKSSLNFFRDLSDENLDDFEKENILSTVNSMTRTDATTFSNFRNTIKTVRNEAKMVRNMGRNFDSKRKTMEGFFKRINLPEIKEYEEMFETKNYFKNNSKNINKNKIKFDNNNNLIEKNEKTNNIIKEIAKKNLKLGQGSSKKYIKNKLIDYKIFADMQRTYNDKKKLWEQDDLKKENIKKEKLEHIKRTQKYLDEMSKNTRTPHLFVDPYSKRDDIINDRIKLFTRSLSGPFYSKKNMQSRIDDFNDYIEQKEIEKKIKDKKLAETLKEEELKLKKEDIQFQIKQKMIENFAKEEQNKKDNDIQLDYKFIPTLKANKKKDKDKSYKYFKEIFEIVKNKEMTKKNYLNEYD